MIGIPSMRNIIPEGKLDTAEVKYYEISKEFSNMTMKRALLNNRAYEYCPPGKYVKLLINGHIVMSDTAMEAKTNTDIVNKATGNVLIAGLGLGTILIPILSKPEVKSVLVLENNLDVIHLVYPHVTHPKLVVIAENVFHWTPDFNTRFDTIYFDIWPSINTDNLKEIYELHYRFEQYKSCEDSYMDSWVREHLEQIVGEREEIK